MVVSDVVDVRDFVDWIRDDLVAATRRGRVGHHARRLDGGPQDVYGTSDIACILWSIGALDDVDPDEVADWQAAFDALQDPATGWFVEREPSHLEIHAAAFAVAAQALLGVEPAHPLRFLDRWRDPESIAGWLGGLDWERFVYLFSHEGAGVASLAALRPQEFGPGWLDRFFVELDRYVDPATGMHGVGKPAAGDTDQIGGTFHYAFVHEHCGVPLPHSAARVDAVLGLQRDDGLWDEANPLWLTLDGVYLLTRAVADVPGRRAGVEAAVARALRWLGDRVVDPASRHVLFGGDLGVHGVTAAISTLAEGQRFLGPDVVVTEEPLQLVLDERPFV